MIIRSIRTNIYKILTGYGFYICVIFTAVLCFSSYIYEDFVTGDKYSAVMALKSFDRDFLLSDTSFCSFEIMRQGAGSWLTLFIPIISAFAFIPLVCDEHEAKSVRFEIFRGSRTGYYISRFLTACLCGGFAVMLGFAIFTALEYMVFPSINEYSADLREMYEETLSYSYPDLAQSGYTIPVIKKLGEMFLYGAAWAAPAIMLTSFIKNKYLVLCIPFFVKYGIGQTCIKLQAQATADYENINEKMLKISSICEPDALSYLSDYSDSKKLVLIYNGVLLLLAGAVYLIIQGRRLDSGE